MTKTVEIKIDNFLIKEAEQMLEQYPKTVAQQLEKWIYIGIAASLRLTESEVVALQLGTGKLVFIPKDEQ